MDKGLVVWYCHGCGDGPIGSWQNACAACNAPKSAQSTVEYTGPGPTGSRQSVRSDSNVGLDRTMGYEVTIFDPPILSATNENDYDLVDRINDEDPGGSSAELEKPTSYMESYSHDDNTDTALYNEDNMSIVSTSQDSVFSVESSGTSATTFSRESGFSVEQIQSATRVFVSILQEDHLMPLYESARNNSRIGPNRLRRYIREAVKTYAENLKEEAEDHLQFAASRLVHARARYAARCIASGEHHGRNRATRDPEDSSEDEIPVRTFDETEFGNLLAFRIFLTESSAYANLQAQIQAFCTESPTMSRSERAIEDSETPPALESIVQPTWRTWQLNVQNLAHAISEVALFLLTEIAHLLTDGFLISGGFLEPPLEPGWTRIRAQCSCGDNFFDDVIEQRTGGVAALVQEMRRSLMDLKITVLPYQTGSTIQQYTSRCSVWFRDISSRIVAAPFLQSRRTTGLPQHNGGRTAPVNTTTNVGNPQQHQCTLHLMYCVHRSKDHTILLQDNLESIGTDQALFEFLKSRISRRRNRLRIALSCRSVEGIFFTKFRLRLGGFVEVRPHRPCCTSTPQSQVQHPVPSLSPMQSQSPYVCECLPPVAKVEPSSNAEYRCKLRFPPGTWPPVGSKHLLHMLKCPNTVDPSQKWIYNLVPKRTTGQLHGVADEPTDGWGLYFEEGWNVGSILLITLIIMLASLLFGICWSVIKSDIQGAFGVSAYVGTVCGLIIAFLVVQTGKTD